MLDNDDDSDGTLDPATVEIITPPEHGNYEINQETGEITYTPEEEYAGIDSFEYTVNDNEGATSNTATVTITIESEALPEIEIKQPLDGGF